MKSPAVTVAQRPQGSSDQVNTPDLTPRNKTANDDVPVKIESISPPWSPASTVRSTPPSEAKNTVIALALSSQDVISGQNSQLGEDDERGNFSGGEDEKRAAVYAGKKITAIRTAADSSSTPQGQGSRSVKSSTSSEKTRALFEMPSRGGSNGEPAGRIVPNLSGRERVSTPRSAEPDGMVKEFEKMLHFQPGGQFEDRAGGGDPETTPLDKQFSDQHKYSVDVPASAAVAQHDIVPTAVGISRLSTEATLQGLVLPCEPADDEKVLYLTTRRWAIISFGLFAFVALLCGMSLLTISSPYFYWCGLPTVYTFVSVFCHYIGVSIWGKDFNPEEHEEIVRRGSVDDIHCPTVDVFLPVCNEPNVLLANTWNHVLALDYPHVTVHVLDDGAKDEVKALAAQYGFEYVRRDNRPELKKAGNLRNAFAQTTGEVVAIFDADFCPRADFLRETIPYLRDPSIGILQTPQFFRRRDEQTWVEQGAGASQETFYRMVQVNLDRFNASICVGSCALYRRAAVESFGGVVPIEHSEDMYTGYKMTELGYKIKYVPLCLAMGVCPDEPRSFFQQQYRWCLGTFSLVLEGEFWRSDIPRVHKLCFMNGMFYYTQSALLIFMGPTPIALLIWIKAEEVLWYYFGFVLPALFFTLVVIPTWSKQDSITRTIACQRIKILQSYAHLFAVKDRLMGTVATWVPSRGGASRSSSSAYDSSVRLLVIWNIVSTALIVGGSIWRITELPWYHFLIPVAMGLVSCAASLSTLRS